MDQSLMRAIADARDHVRAVEAEIADAKTDLAGLKKKHKAAQQSLDDAIAEALGRSTPSLFPREQAAAAANGEAVASPSKVNPAADGTPLWAVLKDVPAAATALEKVGAKTLADLVRKAQEYIDKHPDPKCHTLNSAVYEVIRKAGKLDEPTIWKAGDAVVDHLAPKTVNVCDLHPPAKPKGKGSRKKPAAKRS